LSAPAGHRGWSVGGNPEDVAVIIYRGTVEIETLTRYGRVPPGTLARGEVTVSRRNCRYLPYGLAFRIQVGDDPRPFAFEVHFGWLGREGKPSRWGRVFRGKGVSFTTNGFLEYLTQSLSCDIEERSTSRGNQQFRFIGVEWEKVEAKPAKPKPKRR
jgi:hypothetical protein